MNINAKLVVKNHTVDQVISFLINDRSKGSKKLFLNPPLIDEINFESLFNNPKKSLSSFSKLVKLLQRSLKNHDRVVIFGDYDADGICSTAIMWEALYNLGCDVFPFIPNRTKHGYGLSKEGIDEIFVKYKPSLIISVDNGISAVEGVDYAKKNGINIVVTDHHIAPKKLPMADAIIHSTQVSGSGLAYFTCREIGKVFNKDIITSEHLALSAIGSIADLVPVVGPTRSIIHHGLKEIRSTQKHGLRLMIENRKEINMFDVSFVIAPIVNVFGRIDDPMDGLRLLCTKNFNKASKLYIKAQKLINTRKLLTEGINKVEKPIINDNIIALVSSGINEGVIGLIAADLLKKHNKPAFVLCPANGFYKGSIRSTKQVDISFVLDKLKPLVVSSGGHKLAGGFVIEKKNIEDFLNKANDLLSDMIINQECDVDVIMPVNYSQMSFIRKILQLSPFGPGNEIPIFASEVELIEITSMGKTKAHAKIITKENSQIYDFVYFNGYFESKNLKGKKAILVYQLEINDWNGAKKPLRKVITLV